MSARETRELPGWPVTLRWRMMTTRAETKNSVIENARAIGRCAHQPAVFAQPLRKIGNRLHYDPHREPGEVLHRIAGMREFPIDQTGHPAMLE